MLCGILGDASYTGVCCRLFKELSVTKFGRPENRSKFKSRKTLKLSILKPYCKPSKPPTHRRLCPAVGAELELALLELGHGAAKLQQVLGDPASAKLASTVGCAWSFLQNLVKLISTPSDHQTLAWLFLLFREFDRL